MTVTFMIGNGFDINCGLKCTFRDVCAGYAKTESKSEVIADFKKNINRDLDTWADFEMAMKDYMPNFKSEADFLLCARDFKAYMIEHLRKEENGFLNNPRAEKIKAYDFIVNKEMIASITSFYDGISHNVNTILEDDQQKVYYFITFNYTKIFDKLIQPTDLNSGIVHIHGTLDDAPVVGIDNGSQFSNDLTYTVSKRTLREFVKPYFNQEYDAMRVFAAEKIIETSTVICVYGMSLGESDLTWREQIIKWLKADKKHRLFLYSYDCSCKKYSSVPERMDMEEEEKQLFLQRMGVDDKTANELFDRIHIPIGKNIFNIKKIIDDGYKEQIESDAKKEEIREKLKDQSIGSLQSVGA